MKSCRKAIQANVVRSITRAASFRTTGFVSFTMQIAGILGNAAFRTSHLSIFLFTY